MVALCDRSEAESGEQISACKHLLRAGADVNLLQPLRAAVRRGKATIVQMLLDKKADPNGIQYACLFVRVRVLAVCVVYKVCVTVRL